MLEDHRIIIDVEDVEISEDVVWFFSSDYNGLFSKNIRTNETKVLGPVPNEKQQVKRLYSSIKKCGSRIFLIPFWANELAVFEIEKNIYRKVAIKTDKVRGIDENTRYMGVEVLGNELYMFGVNKPVIVVMDIDTYQIVKVVDVSILMPDIEDEGEPYFRKQVLKRDNKIYATLCKKNCVVEISNMDLNIYRIDNINHGFSGIDSEDGKKFVLAPMYENDDMIIWDSISKQKEVYPSISKKNGFCCVGGIMEGANVYLFPSEVGKIHMSSRKDGLYFLEGKYSFVKRIGKVVVAYERIAGVLEVYDCNKKRGKKYISIDVLYSDSLIEKELYDGGTLEGKGKDISFLMDYIIEKPNDIVKIKRRLASGKKGKQIYTNLKFDY